MKTIFLWSLLIIFLSACTEEKSFDYTKLRINEVCINNYQTISDETGSFEDWFEIYNDGDVPINLLGCHVSKDTAQLKKWEFPDVTLGPKKYLLVFASGKKRETKELCIYQDPWRYNVQPTLPDHWLTSNYDISGWPLVRLSDDSSCCNVNVQPRENLYFFKKITIFDKTTIQVANLLNLPTLYSLIINGVVVNRGTNAENAGINIEPHLKNGVNSIVLKIPYANSFENVSPPRLSIRSNNRTKPSFTYFLHANFKLSPPGETLFLASPDSIIDRVNCSRLRNNHTWGMNNSGEWMLFEKATPGAVNDSIFYDGYVTVVPEFSLKPGFYQGPQMLNIKVPAGVKVYYTTDGSIPTVESTPLVASILIDSTIIIKARCFEDSKLPGPVITHSYLINEVFTLPVVSLSTDPYNLWDEEAGIYALGKHADTVYPFTGATFWLEKEIPVYWELFTAEGELLHEQLVGVEIHGKESRGYPQKTLLIKAKKEYGKGSFKYPLFNEKAVDSYKRFRLRNGGSDFEYAHFTDALCQKLIRPTYNATQSYQPVVVFLNGEYWGLQNLREKTGKYYLAENYDADIDGLDLIINWTFQAAEGSSEDFNVLLDFVNQHDLSSSSAYATVSEALDIPVFLDYFITQLYLNNEDWPVNNVKIWRDQKAASKWRYMISDLDATLRFQQVNAFDQLRQPDVMDNEHTQLFFKLLENESFREMFITRYCDLLNTVFQPEDFKTLAYHMRDEIAGEMPRHLQKWGWASTWGDLPERDSRTFTTWNEYIDSVMIPFIEQRPAFVRSHLQQEFELDRQVRVTVKVQPAGAGTVKINTITLDSLPWKGIYFKGLPLTFKAEPNKGYSFSDWRAFGGLIELKSDALITLNPEDDVTILVVYNKSETRNLSSGN